MLEEASKTTTTTTAMEGDRVGSPSQPPRRRQPGRPPHLTTSVGTFLVVVAAAVIVPPHGKYRGGRPCSPVPATLAASASVSASAFASIRHPTHPFSSHRPGVETASFDGPSSSTSTPRRPPLSSPTPRNRGGSDRCCGGLNLAPPKTSNRHGRHTTTESGAVVGVGPLFSMAPTSSLVTGGGVRSVASAALRTSGVQKVLELGVVAAIGASLRDRLDARAVTALLLNALVPAVIVSSLSTVRVSPDLGLVAASGALLTLVQIVSGELASRLVIPIPGDDDESQPKETSRRLRRTAAAQLGTMAPALSVYSFTREFAGASYVGLAALADVPNKIYTLLIYPYWLRLRARSATAGSADGNGDRGNSAASVVGGKSSSSEPRLDVATLRKRIAGILGDPFNLSIVVGLLLAACRRPISSLGFAGCAVGSLAKAQTAILFLLIGLRLKFSGDRPTLCLRLLLARHGLVGLATSVFLRMFLPPAGVGERANRDAARLAVVLSSQAAASIVAFGQMSKVVEAEAETNAGEDGNGDAGEPRWYDVDLAFDIVALSFPLTVALNSAASLGGAGYVSSLPAVSVGLLAMSSVLGFAGGAGEREGGGGDA